MKKIEVVAAVIIVENQVLLTSRPIGKPPKGLEFPGGKVEHGETLQIALQRELREELSASSIVSDPIYLLNKPNLKIWFMRSRLLTAPYPCEGQEVFWYPLTPEVPPNLLKNDLEFWQFLTQNT